MSISFIYYFVVLKAFEKLLDITHGYKIKYDKKNLTAFFLHYFKLSNKDYKPSECSLKSIKNSLLKEI